MPSGPAGPPSARGYRGRGPGRSSLPRGAAGLFVPLLMFSAMVLVCYQVSKQASLLSQGAGKDARQFAVGSSPPPSKEHDDGGGHGSGGGGGGHGEQHSGDEPASEHRLNHLGTAQMLQHASGGVAGLLQHGLGGDLREGHEGHGLAPAHAPTSPPTPSSAPDDEAAGGAGPPPPPDAAADAAELLQLVMAARWPKTVDAYAPLPPPPPEHEEVRDYTELFAEYHAPVVEWGDTNLQDSAEACSASCRSHGRCNVWAWCGTESGCDVNPETQKRNFRECWLKRAEDLEVVFEEQMGKGGSAHWTSGLLYKDSQMAVWRGKQPSPEHAQAEAQRLAALRSNTSLPLVYMDVNQRDFYNKVNTLGRVEIVLFSDVAPLAAENARRLFLGTYANGTKLKGATFYRIIRGYVCQMGKKGPVPLGGLFQDDEGGKRLKHDRKGLLSMVNRGPNTDTNGNYFSFMMGPAPQMDGDYAIFGEVVHGWDVLETVNSASKGRPGEVLNYSLDYWVSECGQVRHGKPVPEEVVQAGLADEEDPEGGW